MKPKMRFLVIEGNIGVGKTSLCQKISEEFNAKLVLEQFADNPFLPKFYKNKERYSFPLELSFLAERYTQLKDQVIDADLSHSFLVSDYYFSKSLIFAQSTLSPDEFRLFQKIYRIVFETLPKPDLYVYLHANSHQLLANIKTRGREYEQNIDSDYLESIEFAYFNYFEQISGFPVLVIDINNVDFIHKHDHYQQVKKHVFKSDYKLGINRIFIR